MSTVRIERDGPIAHVILHRPERRNALNYELLDDLYRAALEVEHDADVLCVVLRGDGTGFSAGIDADQLPELTTPHGLRRVQFAFTRAFDRFAMMAKPTIAQIHGWAIGAAFELALACDLRVVAADARLGLPETRMGVIPDVGGCSRLTALVGAGRAKELIMTSAMFDGAYAGGLGIANRTPEAADVDQATRQLVTELLACSPHANGLVKTIINQAAMPTHNAVIDAELAAQMSCISTDHFRQAVQRFQAAPAANIRR